MGLLDELFSGQGGSQLGDLISRFQSGSARETPDQQVAEGYREVAPRLDRDQYRQSAEEAFARLSPGERQQFSEWLRTRASSQGASIPDYDLQDENLDRRMGDDPGQLAEMTTRIRDKEPGVLEQLFGRGGTGGPFDNPVAKIAVAGIAAMAAQRLMGGRR